MTDTPAPNNRTTTLPDFIARLSDLADRGGDYPAAGIPSLLEAITIVQTNAQNAVVALAAAAAALDAARASEAQATAELTRRSSSTHIALPPETLRLWRASAHAARKLIADGSPPPSITDVLDCLVACLDEIERLGAELDKRDATLCDLELSVSRLETAYSGRMNLPESEPLLDDQAVHDGSEHSPLPGIPDVSVPTALLEHGNVFVNGERVSAPDATAAD